KRYDRERNRESVGPADVVDCVAATGPAWNVRRHVDRRHRRGHPGSDRTRDRWKPARSDAGDRDPIRGDWRDGGKSARELAWRDTGGARYPEQRCVELRQHRGGRARGRRARVDAMSRARLFLEFSRPFTLVAPALGFVSGAATAIGAAPREHWNPDLVWLPLIGALMAAVLNAGNNALNQIYDLEIDRI